MAIPVYLQQFKAAGIYRIVFDKSTVAGVDSEILRLVVGYSEKGPFNIPTYVTSISDFKAIYGDISKKLEKRGVFFHRIALQALSAGPIVCLNLKKFDGETVDGASINTDFNPAYDVIDTVKLNVEDIYNTARFWELEAEKLNNLKSADGITMDQYINISTTDTKQNSGTYFIRKAAGTKVNGYNITVSDWFSDSEVPEYLLNYTNSLISDFFAEIYVFKGRFTASQVLASSTLKNYFETAVDASGVAKVDEDGNPVLQLRKSLTNAYGDAVDTLDALYNDETSGAVAHYIGALIPQFRNKQGRYVSLDVLFNADRDTHNMMMSFNVDLLEEYGTANIDLSGRLSIPTETALNSGKVANNGLSIASLFAGNASTTLLGNSNAPVVSEVLYFSNSAINIDANGNVSAASPLVVGEKKIMGTLYVKDFTPDTLKITLAQVGKNADGKYDSVDIQAETLAQLWDIAVKMGAAYEVSASTEGAVAVNQAGEGEDPSYKYYKEYANGQSTRWSTEDAFVENSVEGPKKVITSVARLESISANTKTDKDMNMRVVIEDVTYSTVGADTDDSVYGSSVSFINFDESCWKLAKVDGCDALVNDDALTIYDGSVAAIVRVGDCFLADDGTTDRDNDGSIDDADNFFDNVYVQSVKTVADEFGNVKSYVIKFSGAPLLYNDKYLVRIDAALNQEIGSMIPQYLEGYVYKNDKPAGTGMQAKLDWQNFILSTLTDYKGIRTALLNKSDLDYRYIVDTFESFVDSGCKKVLSFLAKEKQSALAILNFPSVKTFVKCPYTSFTDAKGVFNVDYVVKGYNRKKAATTQFSLPSESDGASFAAFYTPLKFSDGYIDDIVPAAGLVSNLFMEKYSSRQPYYIIAGPNFGLINASGLVGPDYTYSMDELQIIEPFGVNCMVYRPGFGTFINANQTAKQTPVSALSAVNVRELTIYMQDEIEKILQSYQWEFNNATTRQAILDKANLICSRVAGNGGIQAYKCVMDESNNTPEIIDNEMAILSVHIEPGRGCGKMVQELTLYKTGQMSSYIID